MRRVAFLENAFSIGYSMPLNGLFTASFSLPANDPKVKECKSLYFVELYDERERVELFRIVPNTATRSNNGQTVTYQCEHVLATLLDDVMFLYHTIGNLGVYTANVLTYILSKQTTERWQLGAIDFHRQFEYNWENENLLSALFSVPKPFDEEYQWSYDTTSYPWKINLMEPSQGVDVYIRYGTNMQGITKTVDPTGLCTRMYGLGYGEGVNQLTFSEINGGIPYVEDAAAQEKYGIVSRIFADTRFQFAETLKARCVTLLNQLKEPRVTYSTSASEISQLNGQKIYKFVSGANVRVLDAEMGEDFIARIVKVSKNDLRGAPGDVQLEIANRGQDLSGTIADLANRQRISEVYAQGATNLDSHDFADNCDPLHPAVLRLYIPEETARINKVRLSYKSEAFRSYERAIEAAPAVTSGPSSTTTTASGGATTSGPSSVTTTGVSGGQTGLSTTGGGVWNIGSGTTNDMVSFQPNHDHGIDYGTQLQTVGGGSVTWVPSGGHRHILDHHDHQYATLDHSHGMDHTHSIAPHTHGMDHTHQIPSHTHDIEYGIFEGPTPSSVSLDVDGNNTTLTGTSVDDFDIIPFLSKDTSGKVLRGWHEIKITPNSLGRIVSSVNIQLFVQSRGGGDY
ncbi:hypothetical protein GC096_03890 [Paenibacillus sp. LMG 31461]|uniref:Tail spike domain-containing protein n=2 Tax=Paenibacillus plantarum TaxID=2654975 RepID=A0ABX1X452_9BACL|nr:hypothetical protein [Paenibacillus plantarum]